MSVLRIRHVVNWTSPRLVQDLLSAHASDYMRPSRADRAAAGIVGPVAPMTWKIAFPSSPWRSSSSSVASGNGGYTEATNATGTGDRGWVPPTTGRRSSLSGASRTRSWHQAPVSPWSHERGDVLGRRHARPRRPVGAGCPRGAAAVRRRRPRRRVRRRPFVGGRSSHRPSRLIGVDANATMLAAFEDAARSAGRGRARRCTGVGPTCAPVAPDRRCGGVPPRVLQRRRRRPVCNRADRARPVGCRGRDTRSTPAVGLERGVQALLGSRPSGGPDR